MGVETLAFGRMTWINIEKSSNEDLTVISVIIMPLTLLSGIYGMNISLPLDEHPFAFLFVVCLMLLLAGGMLLWFRRQRWL